MRTVPSTPPRPPRTPLATLAYRALVVALAGLAVIGQIAYLDVLYWRALGLGSLGQVGIHPALLSSVITGATVTTISAAAAAFLVLRPTDLRGAYPLAVSLAGWGYLLAYSGLTVLLAPDPASPMRGLFVIHFLLVEALASAALLRFTACFPQRLDPESLEAPENLPAVLRPLQAFRGWLLGPTAPWIAALGAAVLVVAVNATLGRPIQDAALLLLADVFRLATLAFVILNMRKTFILSGIPGRRRMFWFVAGFAVLLSAVGMLLGGNILSAVTGWEVRGFNWRPVVLDLGVVGLIGGAVMAVTYDGALKPGKLTRRLAVAASFLTIGLFLAAGLETLFAGALASRVSLGRGVGTLVSLLAMGILYARTRRPLEGMIYQAWAVGGEGGGSVGEPPSATSEAAG